MKLDENELLKALQTVAETGQTPDEFRYVVSDDGLVDDHVPPPKSLAPCPPKTRRVTRRQLIDEGF